MGYLQSDSGPNTAGQKDAAFTSLATQAGGGLLGAIGGVAQGFSQAQSYKYNAAVAMANAAQAHKNANMVANEGETAAGIESTKTKAQLGSTRANIGAGGVNVNTGSASSVQVSEDQLGKLDSMQIRSNAAKAAYGYQTQEVNFKNEAAQDRQAASNALTSGWLSGVGTLLGTASEGASEWSKFAAAGAL